MRTLFQSEDELSLSNKPNKAGRMPAMSRRQFLLSTAAVTASLGCQPRRSAAKPMNVVVFLADTVRPDHLNCYGYARRTTPVLNAFAQDSVVFDQCYSQCCWTKPSIGSLFSGFLPQVHRAGDSDWDFGTSKTASVQALRPKFTTLGEQFQRLGYRTAYFLSNAYLQERFGFARGFDHYRYQNAWPPAEQVQAAVEWLKQEAQEPFFLFIHEIDPHQPYTPSAENFQRLFGRTQEDAIAALPAPDRAEILRIKKEEGVDCSDPVAAIRQGFINVGRAHLNFSAEGQAYFKDCYDAEILGVDEQFGRILNCLRELDVEDRTAVVFASDHGESFGEHGWYAHGNCLYNPEVRVPLVLRLPASMRRQERVPWTVSLFDLHPTLVALAGGEVGEGLQAKPLLLPDGATVVDRHRECFTTYNQPAQEIPKWEQAMIHGPWKAHLTQEGQRLAVYNLKDDPGEMRDLLAEGAAAPEAVRQIVNRFKQAQEQHLILSASYGEPTWVSGDESFKEDLSALGYL